MSTSTPQFPISEPNNTDVIKIYTDGSHWSRYDLSAIGGVAIDGSGKKVFEFKENLSKTSNPSYHELYALKKALQIAQSKNITHISCFSDCKPVIEHLNHMFNRIKKKHTSKAQGEYKEIMKEIYTLLSSFESFELTWLPRKENKIADRLSKPNLWQNAKASNFITHSSLENETTEQKNNISPSQSVVYCIDALSGLGIYKVDLNTLTKTLVFASEQKKPSAIAQLMLEYFNSLPPNSFTLSFRLCEIGVMFESYLARKLSSKTLWSYEEEFIKMTTLHQITLTQNETALSLCFGNIQHWCQSDETAWRAIKELYQMNCEFITQDLLLNPLDSKELSQACRQLYYFICLNRSKQLGLQFASNEVKDSVAQEMIERFGGCPEHLSFFSPANKYQKEVIFVATGESSKSSSTTSPLGIRKKP